MKSLIKIVLSGMLLLVLSFTGCVRPATRGGEYDSPGERGKYQMISGPLDEKAGTAKEENVSGAGDVYIDGREAVEIIPTPFGYVKRELSPPEKAPATASVPEEQEIGSPDEQGPVVSPLEASGQTAVSSSKEGEPVGETTPRDQTKTLAGNPSLSSTALEAGPTGPESRAAEVEQGEAAEHQTSGVSFDFDGADLESVIRVMADFLEINYVIDPGIAGKVTIHTAGLLKDADVFPVFYQTLEVNGLTAVREGNVYRITRLKDAARLPIAARLKENMADIPPEERIVLQLIPLEFISAQEITKIITPFISAEGLIVSGGTSNMLVVVDKGINILKILQLVDVFDVSVFEKINYRFYPVNNADVEDLSKALEEILLLADDSGKSAVKLIPLKWLSTLLVVSSIPDVFNQAEQLIRQMDVPSQGAQPQIYVYSVKNGMAVDLGDTLRAIFNGGGSTIGGSQRESVPTNPFAKGAAEKEAPSAPESEKSVVGERPAASANGPSAMLHGEVKITDDQIRNMLIIEALPKDYKIVEGILERLDVLPRQVLIDVVIAEVTLGKGTELGIEWTFKKEDWSDTGSLSAVIGGSGLQYAMGLSEKWQAALHALADDSKLNIISSPSVLASDNKAAKIDVTTEVPIPSTNYTYVNDGNNLLETSVEYRDTGVILEVTPHINEYGLVTMDISQEVSNVGSLIKVAGQDYYSFDRKKILTCLTVKHNQSIVIGGLISNERKNASSGVPWLTRIPIIRWLTGTETKKESRSELIVMITPHVITSLKDVDAVSDEFRKKVSETLAVFEEL